MAKVGLKGCSFLDSLNSKCSSSVMGEGKGDGDIDEELSLLEVLSGVILREIREQVSFTSMPVGLIEIGPEFSEISVALVLTFSFLKNWVTKVCFIVLLTPSFTELLGDISSEMSDVSLKLSLLVLLASFSCKILKVHEIFTLLLSQHYHFLLKHFFHSLLYLILSKIVAGNYG
ncbi:hypothetical protein FF38_08246 [Lucilia cuprina]|uniref:Uncharacterized protein n=1 Tax=Lucilia cuprina TaxID=7375 RepID=A0A0L0BYU4_LUCCU|nr:hypothetical protein FF38_08246 [Lucilia cuprina]